MTPSAQTNLSGLSGPRKAAVFLMGIGDEASAEVLRRLAPEEVRRITAEITALRSVKTEQMASVFQEFERLTAESRLFAKGGVDCARRLVEQAFGPESAQRLLAAPDPDSTPQAGTVLEKLDPRQAAALLKNEHPQTIAVVLSSIPPDAGAGLLKSLPAETQDHVASRIAMLDRIPGETTRRIREALGSKLKNIRHTANTDGVRALAALLNHMDAERTEAILARVEEQSPPLADSVRSLMFVFEDILKIDKEAMKALIGKLDRKVLTLALKGSAPGMRNHFTQCMSQRAAEMLTEDMEALGPVRIRDVKTAQKEVIAAVRRLQQEGAISLGTGGEEYVV